MSKRMQTKTICGIYLTLNNICITFERPKQVILYIYVTLMSKEAVYLVNI